MYDEKNFLYESFQMYFENAKRAQANGNIALAKRNLLLAAEALYKMAKTDSAELKAARIKRADALVEAARNLTEKGSTGGARTVGPRGGNNGSVGNRSVANNDDSETEWAAAAIPDIGFKDVAGLEDVKASIRMLMIDPVKYPEKYAAYNKKSGGGVLLYGPPGTGKTMIAKAIAHEVGATFYAVKGSDIVSKWVGESERNINALFESARKQKLSIIFIDEMDSLFGQRGKDTHNDKRVNEFLQQIDGFAGKNPNLLLLGATNRPWDVDSAAVRSGRFSQKIYVPLPDKTARKYLFKLYLKGAPLSSDVDMDTLVKMTERYSGADIAEVCDRAKEEPLKAYIRTDIKGDITMAHLKAAIGEVVPMVDEKEIARFEVYAGLRKQGTPKAPEEKPEKKDDNLVSAPDPVKKEDQSKENKNEESALGKVMCATEIPLVPGVKPVFEFYIDGDHNKVSIGVMGKRYLCEKRLMNYVSEPLDVGAGGKTKVEIYDQDNKIAEVEVNFINGMTEDDMGL